MQIYTHIHKQIHMCTLFAFSLDLLSECLRQIKCTLFINDNYYHSVKCSVQRLSAASLIFCANFNLNGFHTTSGSIKSSKWLISLYLKLIPSIYWWSITNYNGIIYNNVSPRCLYFMIQSLFKRIMQSQWKKKRKYSNVLVVV